MIEDQEEQTERQTLKMRIAIITLHQQQEQMRQKEIYNTSTK